MTIITGTALSKNTPVEVLQELEWQERRALEQGNEGYEAPTAGEQEEPNAPETHIQLHRAMPVRE